MNTLIWISLLLTVGAAIPVEENAEDKKLGEMLAVDEYMTPQQRQQLFGKGARRKRAARVKGYNWSNGVVPYKFSTDTFSSEEMETFQSVLSNIQKHTCLRFVWRTNQENYIDVQKEEGCWSVLGMVGGEQPLSLDSACRSIGTVHHELFHALGLIHEQQRPDRDGHVRIAWENMDDEKRAQFDKANAAEIEYHGVSYDFSSLMQYPFRSFSNNKKDTIVPLNEPNARDYVGHLWTKPPSYGDYKLLNEQYQCAKHCNTACSKLAFVDKDCQCITPYSFYQSECKGDENAGWCKLYKDYYMRK